MTLLYLWLFLTFIFYLNGDKHPWLNAAYLMGFIMAGIFLLDAIGV